MVYRAVFQHTTCLTGFWVQVRTPHPLGRKHFDTLRLLHCRFSAIGLVVPVFSEHPADSDDHSPTPSATSSYLRNNSRNDPAARIFTLRSPVFYLNVPMVNTCAKHVAVKPEMVYPCWGFSIRANIGDGKITALCRKWEFHQSGFEIGSEGTGVHRQSNILFHQRCRHTISK